MRISQGCSHFFIFFHIATDKYHQAKDTEKNKWCPSHIWIHVYWHTWQWMTPFRPVTKNSESCESKWLSSHYIDHLLAIPVCKARKATKLEHLQPNLMPPKFGQRIKKSWACIVSKTKMEHWEGVLIYHDSMEKVDSKLPKCRFFLTKIRCLTPWSSRNHHLFPPAAASAQHEAPEISWDREMMLSWI